MEKRDKFELDNGEIKDILVKTLSYSERNKILKEYIDINTYVKSDKQEEKNVIDYIKTDKSILDFTQDILSAGIKNIVIDDLTPNEGDKLFEKYGAFILSGGGVSKN